MIDLFIKNIKFLKREKNYLIEVDDYSFAILEDTLVRFNLYKGKELEILDIENILKEDSRYKSKNLALKYLSNMKSEKEVRDYLFRKEISDEIIDDTIFYLKSEKFLDDYQYALLFSKDKLNLNKYGKNKIKMSLRAKGISQNIIDNVLLELPEDKEYTNLLKAAEKKKNSLGDDDKFYEKLVRHLLYKGYDYDLIKKALSEMRNNLWCFMYIF